MDIGNILQQVLGGGQQYPMSGTRYDPAASVAPQAGAPGLAALSQRLMSQGNGVKATMSPAAQSPVAQQARPRRSIIDIIGGIGNALAVGGGIDPVYESATDRQIREAQRDRKIRMEEMQLRGAEDELAGNGREQLGMALGALVDSDNPAEMWPQIAEAAGVDPAKAAQIGQALQANPALAKPLATAMGYRPPAQGSQPKELQIYNLLQNEDPDAAEAYLQSLTQGKPMSEKDRAMVGLAQERVAIGWAGVRDRQARTELIADRPPTASGAAGPKPPAGVVTSYVDTNSAISHLDRTIAAVEKNPKAFGITNAVVPDLVLQRTDPKGVGARALVSDVGSLVIHDRTGATMAAKEAVRLNPFIPSSADDPKAIITKLKGMRQRLQEDQKYRLEMFPGLAPNAAPAPAKPSAPRPKLSARIVPRKAPAPPGGVKVTTPEEARKLPPGTRFQTPDGVWRVRS